MVPEKRVHLIYESIQKITRFKIEWTHIGDGTEYNNLLKQVKRSKNNVTVKLLGRLSHNDVMKYYKNNHIDAFINVSYTEGLPVSIMEAIAFNIPVIGTNVGGSSEIIVNETGVLLSSTPEIDEIINAIEKIRTSNFKPKAFWKENFFAEKNYNEFISLLQSI